MALRDLDLDRWRSMTDRAAVRLAGDIAVLTGAELVEVSTRDHASGPGRYALFRRDAVLYGLVPGGSVQVGYDGNRFVPSPGQLASYADSYEEYGVPGEDYGLPEDIREYVEMCTSPPRTAEIPPLLVAVRARDAGLTRVAPDHRLIRDLVADAQGTGAREIRSRRVTDPAEPREIQFTLGPRSRRAEQVRQARVLLAPDGTVTDAWLMYSLADDIARMAAGGRRLLSPDGWEHACGAGAGTLFRWGDGCPADRYPGPRGIPFTDRVEADRGPHLEPNAFGLHIAQSPTRYERTADPQVVCGGDGGGAACGGSGFFLGWLTLATSFRDDTHRHVDKDEFRDILVRPAIPLD